MDGRGTWLMGADGVIRIARREVKFLDPCKTTYCEGKWPVLFRQSGTKLGGAKMIRYRRSPKRKRCQPGIGSDTISPSRNLSGNL